MLRNTSNQLPLSFEVDRAAHFAVSPAEGLLLPGDAATMTVTFTPRQPGRLRNHLLLHVGHGTTTARIAVSSLAHFVLVFVCCGVLPVLSLAHTRMGLNLLRVLKGDSGRVLEASSRVGFDTLPDQFVNNEQKRGFRFNLACIGESSV